MIEKPPDCGLKKAQGFVAQATNHAVLRVISATMPCTRRGDTMTREVLHQVVKASPIDGSRIAVTFENGVGGTYDCAYLMEDPYWARLKTPAYFRQVKAECGTLVWPGDLDVAPESVWERSIKDCSSHPTLTLH